MGRIKLLQEHVDAATVIYEHGWYTLSVEELNEGQDKEGAALYKFQCRIIDATDEENKRFIGKKAWIQVSEKGFGFGIPFFRACGAEIPDRIPADGLDLDMRFCVGKKILAQNNPGLDRNKVMRNNWSTFARME